DGHAGRRGRELESERVVLGVLGAEVILVGPADDTGGGRRRRVDDRGGPRGARRHAIRLEVHAAAAVTDAENDVVSAGLVRRRLPGDDAAGRVQGHARRADEEAEAERGSVGGGGGGLVAVHPADGRLGGRQRGERRPLVLGRRDDREVERLRRRAAAAVEYADGYVLRPRLAGVRRPGDDARRPVDGHPGRRLV